MSTVLSSVIRVCIFIFLVAGAAGQWCPNPFNATSAPNPQVEVTRSLKLWQGVSLIICFGVFGLFVSLIYRLIRAYVFHDGSLLDTYFDAGGEANFAMVACCVVAKRLWAASYTFSTDNVAKYGILGHYWYSAAGAVHLLLFAILAAEIRIKAPGAKTFLQVIKSRFGPVPHITVMIFAFVTNIIIAGLVMSEGTRILTWLCQDIDQFVVCFILTLAVGLYTLIGGVGGTMYAAYFFVSCVVAICLVYFSDSTFNSLNRPDYRFADFFPETYSAAYCADAGSGKLLSFINSEGIYHGVILALAGFSAVVLDQGYWLTAISARPDHSAWGYLTGAFVWFSIPFLLSFILGMSYWKFAVDQGTPLVTEKQASFGVIAVIVSQQLLGRFGDFMTYALIIAVVLGAVSSEILSMSSIIVYDIYQTYISPFGRCRMEVSGNACFSELEKRKQAEDEYIRYNRKCVIVQWVVVIAVTILVYPITLIIIAIGVPPQWLFSFFGIIVGSAVFPVIFSVVWHRTTGAGVMTGVLGGLICGFTAWLAYASRFDKGLAWFQGNTERQEVVIVGLAVSLGVGGLACIIVSLSCGGCDQHRKEAEVWKKCRPVDDPVFPWAIRYYSSFSGGGANRNAGLTHFHALKKRFKCAEVSAYFFCVLLFLVLWVVWPALMRLANIFTESFYHGWGIMVFVCGVIAGVFICLTPLLYEVIDKCCVSYHIRLWKHRLAVQQPPVVEPCELQTQNTCVRSGGTYGRSCGTYGRSGGTYGRSGGTYGRSGGTYGRSGGTYGRSGGTYGRSGGTYGRSGGTYGRSCGAYGLSGGTCHKGETAARRTYRLADMSVTNANLYPTRYHSGYSVPEYLTHPTSGICVGTLRVGTTKRGWETLIHLD